MVNIRKSRSVNPSETRYCIRVHYCNCTIQSSTTYEYSSSTTKKLPLYNQTNNTRANALILYTVYRGGPKVNVYNHRRDLGVREVRLPQLFKWGYSTPLSEAAFVHRNLSLLSATTVGLTRARRKLSGYAFVRYTDLLCTMCV